MAANIDKEKLLRQLLEIDSIDTKPELIDIYIVLSLAIAALQKHMHKQ